METRLHALSWVCQVYAGSSPCPVPEWRVGAATKRASKLVIRDFMLLSLVTYTQPSESVQNLVPVRYKAAPVGATATPSLLAETDDRHPR
jgi:hypothetical protein